MCRRPVEALVKIIDQMEDSPIANVRGRPRTTIGEIIERDLDYNGLNVNMIYDRKLWHRLIDIAGST